MDKKQFNKLALTVTEFMAERGNSILTLTAQKCLDKGTHQEYLKMIWEQANQASREVNKILGDDLFNQVLTLKESDFK